MAVDMCLIAHSGGSAKQFGIRSIFGYTFLLVGFYPFSSLDTSVIPKSNQWLHQHTHSAVYPNQMLSQRVFYLPSSSTTQNVSVNMNKVDSDFSADIKQTLIQTKLMAQLMQKCRKITCAVFSDQMNIQGVIILWSGGMKTQ